MNESNRPSAALDGEQHVSGAARKRKRPPSPRQIAKNSETRRRLIEAAGLVVGKYGYAGASIARITAKAGVAHGTFYLHFANQQALFDVLLRTRTEHARRDLRSRAGQFVPGGPSAAA